MLGVVRLEPNCTAYRVRQVFLASRSTEWSGSAGAVYPAVNRLQVEGLIGETPEQDGRGTKTYRLTPAGRKQLAREESKWKQLAAAVATVMWPAPGTTKCFACDRCSAT